MAAIARRDPAHAECVRLLRGAADPLLVPILVLGEAAYFVAERLGATAEAALLRDAAAGRYEVQSLTTDDLTRTAELVEQYRDLPLGTVDASVIALAERLRITTVATLDRRHFTVVRPRHVSAFTLLP